MKRVISAVLFFALFSGAVFANEISYFNKSWDEIKAKAKMEHKYIFVDCYTDWCGWCKKMDKETMVDPAVVAAMNDKFIAVKMDMEHGEGVKLAMKYHISGYPSFMFFNPDGALVYESVGYQKSSNFMDELSNALDKTKQFNAPGFSNSIDIDFPDFYKNAFAENGKRKFPEKEEVTAFLDKQADLFSEINWGVISRFDLNEKYTKFFMDNIDKYKNAYGGSNVDNKLNSIINRKLKDATKSKDNAAFTEVLKMVDKYEKENAAATKINFRISYYMGTRNWVKLNEAINELIVKDKYENADEINSLSWSIYENCDDKTLVKNACKWMGKVTAKQPSYAYMDTYAAVLYKSGQLKQAEDWANKAIDAGKKSGDATTSTEELLTKIKEHTNARK